jgi:hypothetical protein
MRQHVLGDGSSGFCNILPGVELTPVIQAVNIYSKYLPFSLFHSSLFYVTDRCSCYSLKIVLKYEHYRSTVLLK